MALRAWAEADVSALVRACSDELVARFTSVPAPYTPEDARMFVAAGRSDSALPLAVVQDGEPAQVLGAVGLHAVDLAGGRSEIGYWTAPWARRQRVASRGLTLLSVWALRALGLDRLELYAEPSNRASQLVAERAGYVRGDLVHGGITLRGRRRDVVRFVLTSRDLERLPLAGAPGDSTRSSR